jgi:hypothetical protein
MLAAVVVGGLRLNRHEPRCAGGLECHACRADCCAGTLRGIKAIDVPKHRLLRPAGISFFSMMLHPISPRRSGEFSTQTDISRAAAMFAVSSESSSIVAIVEHAVRVFIVVLG